jgi:hypothetical protein
LARRAITPRKTQYPEAFAWSLRTLIAITQTSNDGSAASQTQNQRKQKNPTQPGNGEELRRAANNMNPPVRMAQHPQTKHGKSFRDFEVTIKTPNNKEIVAKMIVIQDEANA